MAYIIKSKIWRMIKILQAPLPMIKQAFVLPFIPP